MMETHDDKYYYDQAVELSKTLDYISFSTIQRRLLIGYSRAGRVMDMLEANKIIGKLEADGTHRFLGRDE